MIKKATDEDLGKATSFMMCLTRGLAGEKWPSEERRRDVWGTVRFKADRIEETCRHLVTWEDGVTVEKPVRLRRRLVGMCSSLAEHRSA